MGLTLFTESMCFACHQMEEYLEARGVEFGVEDIGRNGHAKNFVQNRQGGRVTVPMLWDGTTARSVVGFSEERTDRFLEGIGWRATRRARSSGY